MTKAIYITPNKEVREVGVHNLQDMQELVGGLIEPISLKDGSTMFANEEGRYIFGPDDFNSIATDVAGLGGRTDILLMGLLGPAFIVGPLDEDGNNTDVTDYVRGLVERVEREA